MSSETNAAVEETPLSTSWRPLALVGALTAIFGVLAVVFPFITGVSISVLLGMLLLASGFVHVAHSFSAGNWKGAIWQVILATLYAIAGIALVVNPLFTLATLTVILAAFFIFNGILEVAMGVGLRGEQGRGWMVASGVLGIVVGALIWIGWPSTAIWAIGILFGVNLLSTGLSLIMLAMSGRRSNEESASLGTKPRGA
ncbi:HdeD family acid-resistance protein [Halococcus sediminicola]|uniref:HdeD family acid-resistance protein n=1 Tax=Halococcus sediminicola TaxID=1264579 RepID=UPI0006792491|nr:HdeD family acid-resistance protein [Halococcus sediminicola]